MAHRLLPCGAMLRTGDRVYHRFNRSLGPGVVVKADDRVLIVEFPDAGERLSFAGSTDALTPLVLTPGTLARLIDSEFSGCGSV